MTSYSLEAIYKIEPKLHRITLSGNYDYPKLKDRLGDIYILPSPGKRHPNYRSKSSKQWEGIKGGLTIFFNPQKAYFPPCMIELTAPEKETKKILSSIAEKLPGLKLSKIEYAIDLYVREPIRARLLFNRLWKNLCPPYQRGVDKRGQRAKYGKKTVIMTHRNLYKIKSRSKKFSSYFKIYERGNDNDKNNRSHKWDFNNLNRVRIEFTAIRELHDLYNKKLDTLEDLIEDPKFAQMMRNRIQFKRAKRSSKLLPQPYEGYKTPNEQGHIGSFFIESRHAKELHGHTIYQQVENAFEFDKLLNAITLMTEWFDNNWNKSTPLPFLEDFDEDFNTFNPTNEF